MSTPSPRARVFRRSLMTLACVAAAAPAWAQDTTAADPGDQRVEVTGSRLKQIDAEGVSPVQVITREDITRTGASNVKEMIETLSAASTQGTLSDIGGSNSFSPGASGVSLRNLGKQSTLVLLNGRRIAPFPLADYSEVFSNVDSLPLDAIDRIEVLKNGGAAIYGSDAVAGVINIITRSTFQGAQLSVAAQKSLKNGQFGERSGALTVGAGDYVKDGWNVLGNIELFRRDELMWGRVLKDVNPEYGASSPGSYGTTSTYAYPGNLVGVGPVAGCTTVVSNLCRYDRYSAFEAVPATKRFNSLFQARKRLADGTEWFSELLYSDIKVHYVNTKPYYGGALGSTVWGDPTTGATKTFTYADLPVGDPLNPTSSPIDFRYRFVDAPSYQEADTSQYRLLTGLKGEVKSYDWESAVGIMGGSSKTTERGTFSESGFATEIGDPSSTDFFDLPNGYKIGQANSDEVLNTLFPAFGYTAKNQQTFWDGTLRGDIAQLPAGPLQLATGFDLRHETMNITPSANLLDGDIVGYGISSANGERTYGALFAEASIPIVKHLDGSLAGRLDKFPNFGAHFSPKAGLKFQPIEQALFRGTFETGFRAPNLTESAKSTKYAYQSGITDPKRCDAAYALYQALIDQAQSIEGSDPGQASILEARADQVYNNECYGSVPIVTENNPNLKPETSKSFTLGMVLQPFQRWSASIDYWNIRRKNEINTKTPAELLTVEDSLAPGVIKRGTVANDPTFLASDAANYGITLPTVGAITQIQENFENLFQTMTSGVDIGVKGSIPTSFGEFGVNVDATYTLNYRVYSNELGAFGDNLAGRYGTPKWVLNTTGSYKIGDVSQSLRWVYNSSTKLQYDYDDTTWSAAGCAQYTYLRPSQCRVNTYNRFDYSVAYSGIKNLTVGVNIRNVFQTRPPADYRAFGAPSGVIPVSQEDAEGRMGKIVLTYKWL